MEQNKKQEKIVFTTLDNEEVEFYVVEQTMLNGVNYLLVADDSDDSEEANALILKEVSGENDDIIYDEVEDDIELEAVAKVFEELMDDIDIKIENE